jgi:hypothetical protein
MDSYIPLTSCKSRGIYMLHSRNLSIGVFNPENNGFIGIREKFGDKFLFTEFHYDTGAPFGTVRPLKEIGLLPGDILISESLGTIDRLTNRAVSFDKPIDCGGKGWFFTDSGEASERIIPVGVCNNKLFEFLSQNQFFAGDK